MCRLTLATCPRSPERRYKVRSSSPSRTDHVPSFQDMKDRIDILMRQLKRRADAEAVRRRVEGDDVAEG
jgi:hypothetical protein